MFDPSASLARLGLLFALLWRLWAPRPSRAARAALARIQKDLAQALRATLADAGLVAPDGDDVALIAWVARTQPFRALLGAPTRDADRAARPRRARLAVGFAGAADTDDPPHTHFDAIRTLPLRLTAMRAPVQARAPPRDQHCTDVTTALGSAQARPRALQVIVQPPSMLNEAPLI